MEIQIKYKEHLPDENDIIEKLCNSLLLINNDRLRTLKMTEKSAFVQSSLNDFFSEEGIEFLAEHTFDVNQGERFDVYFENNDFAIIIEIDNLRADQISKKAFSRMSMFRSRYPYKKVIYVTLCYLSNSAMGYKKEAKRYLDFHFLNFFTLINNVAYVAIIPKIDL